MPKINIVPNWICACGHNFTVTIAGIVLTAPVLNFYLTVVFENVSTLKCTCVLMSFGNVVF